MKREARDTLKSVTLGFEDDCVTLPIDAILPLRALGKSAKSSRKYRQIVASIAQIGIVEPPVVVRNPDKSATWLLLDGHLRIEALKDAGEQEVECLVSTDDEAFTYNRQVSRLAPIQEHKMIRKAIERGVPEEKIALALDLNMSSIRRKARLLDGICEEAVAILKDKPCTNAVFDALRKMKTMRQIEAAELLVNANNYSVAYVSAILAGTPQAQLVESSKPKKVKGITPEAMARMEQELARLQEGIASIQDTYGQDHLHLTVIKGYVGKLLGNARVVRYLAQNHPEFLGEFQTITEITPAEAADAEWPFAANEGDPDPISAGTAGDAGLWAGSSAAVGMAANPLGAHQAGSSFRRPRGRASCGCVQFGACRRRGHSGTPVSCHTCRGRSALRRARLRNYLTCLVLSFTPSFGRNHVELLRWRTK